MKINWDYIKLVVLLGLVIFLYAFSSARNSNRMVTEPKVTFTGESNLFITNENVSKLLIVNSGGLKNIPKETLVLNKLENALKSSAMIKKAEVYLTVNGSLNAKIEQKTPIARVSTDLSYYVDDNGLYMPLSNNFSARVPIVTGFVDKNNLKNIYIVANKVKEDEFLKKHVIEIHQSNNKVLYLKLRQCQFLVQLGSVKFLDKKINNLKAFYLKNQNKQTLKIYSKINLQFENQVVCTKI